MSADAKREGPPVNVTLELMRRFFRSDLGAEEESRVREELEHNERLLEQYRRLVEEELTSSDWFASTDPVEAPKEAFRGFLAAHRRDLGPSWSALRRWAEAGNTWASELHADLRDALDSLRRVWRDQPVAQSGLVWQTSGDDTPPEPPREIPEEAQISVSVQLLMKSGAPSDEFTLMRTTEPPRFTSNGQFLMAVQSDEPSYLGWRCACRLPLGEGRAAVFETVLRSLEARRGCEARFSVPLLDSWESGDVAVPIERLELYLWPPEQPESG